MTQGIKLPPLIGHYPFEIHDTLREYARAAVALNTPGWRKTADDPPAGDHPMCMAVNPNRIVIKTWQSDVRDDPDMWPYWMPLPPVPQLPAGPETA
jgi:hypothetical protein